MRLPNPANPENPAKLANAASPSPGAPRFVGLFGNRRALGAVLSLLVSGIGATWATWPLATQLGSATIGKTDAWPAAWHINWLHHILLTNPLGWSAANIFFPYENTLATSDLLVTPALLTFPAVFFDSSVLAYNLALVGGIVLCGLAGFLLIEELTGSWWTAVLGGAMLALNPFRFLHIQHLSIIAAWPPALFCWALLRYFRTPSWAWSWTTALSGVLVVGASLYQALYLAPLLPLVVWFAALRGHRDRKTWSTLAVTGAAVLPLVTILAYPYWEAMLMRGIPWNPGDLERFAAHLTSLGVPPPFMGSAENASTLDPEARLFPGAVLSVLGIVAALTVSMGAWKRAGIARWMSGACVAVVSLFGIGLVVQPPDLLRRPWELLALAAVWTIPPVLAIWAVGTARRSPAVGHATAAAFGLATTAWALALSMGPVLHVRGEAIGVAPYALLVRLSSVFEGTRVPARFGNYVVMFLSVAAAAALAYLASLPAVERRLGASAAGVLSILVVAGLAIDLPDEPWGMAVVAGTDLPEYEWLAGVPGDFGILELPETGQQSTWERSYYMLASRRHWKRLVNGTGGKVPPLHEKFFVVEPWSAEFFSFVRSYLPVRYVLVHEGHLPVEVTSNLLPRLAMGHEGWSRAYQGRGAWAFAIDRSSERGPFVERLYVRSDLAPRARLSFDVRVEAPVGSDLAVELLRDDELIGSWPVDAEWRHVSIDVPIEAIAPLGENPWPRTTTLFRWQLVPESVADLELAGIDARRGSEPPS